MPTYDALVRDYHALVFHVAKGVLKDDASAEDAAQDVFLNFLEKPQALDRVDNLKAFVCRAAVNRALELKRRADRREKHEGAAPQRAAAQDPMEAAFRAELRARVSELPEDQRLAVDLHYFRGMTKSEVADSLEVPEGTVSSRLAAALGRLRSALAGAATAAVFAILESELSACAAEEAPRGLSQRLLRLQDGRPLGHAAPRPVVSAEAPEGQAPARRTLGTAAVALSIVALFLIGWGFWRATVTESGAADPGSASGRGDAGTSASSPREPVTSKPFVTPPSVPAGPVRTADGILLRTPDGLTLAEPNASELGGGFRVQLGATPDFPEVGMTGGWVFRDDARLAAFAPATALDLRPFLRGEAEAPSLTRLRVRGRILDGDGSPRSAELLEILEAETLPHAWWSAWRDLFRAAERFRTEWDDVPPGPARRSRIVELAESVADALRRARAARASESHPRRAAMMENDHAGPVAGRLRAAGLGDLLRGEPDPWELHDALMEADTAAALRSRVVGEWGGEALWLEAWVARAWGNGAMQLSIELGLVCELSEAEFARLRDEIRGLPMNRRRGATIDPAELAERRERFAGLGLDVAAIGALERQKLLLEKGTLVVAVEPGSAAERVGLRAGDVLWRWRGTGEDVPEILIDEHEAARLAERWAGGLAAGATLRVVRGDETLNLTLGR
jgi:RNA polymerase sigma-70 factor (ECF subfamily)